ncbi:uncharacterized protein LOC120736336 [Simochromis diagramma]|uniref:uncharacterized protein LOC120736336 n=1 Tax=Simochromis diagramma TaxID=43689 RepID=UPI001A7EFC41|nr:uncharacterized protein LOC120736336 [Simochromis diagramma]
MDWMKVFRTAEMSGATSSVWLWLILVFAIFIKSSSARQINITAVLGENAILPCQVLDGNKTIDGLEWSKPELETKYVLFYRDGHLGLFNQHPSFKDRVDLQDRQMKGGNVSLILNNVTINDTGTYECRVFMSGTNRRKRAHLKSHPISIIYLHVDPPGQTRKSVGVMLSVSLLVAVLLAVAIILIYRRCKKQDPNKPEDQSLLPGFTVFCFQ